jgi:hypothetical protein
MKTFRIIGSIALLLFAVIRIASKCSKNESRQIRNQFVSGCNLVESKRSQVFMYNFNDKDSVEWMTTHTRAFNNTLDSCITYYQGIYTSDENRYKNYLEVLFVYKKLVYLYQGWVKYNREIAAPGSNKKEYENKFRTLQTEERELLFDLQRKTMMLDY